MVPSGATAGAIFTPGRCEPQSVEGGTAAGSGGHGSVAALVKRPGQVVAVPAGAVGVSAPYVMMLVVSIGVTFTSQELTTSLALHGSPAERGASWMTL